MDDEFKSMVRRVKDNHQFTILLLSTNPVPGNREEPLSYVMRRLMIHEAFPELFIAPLMDMASTKKWVSMLEGKIRESFPLMSARIYAAPEIVAMYKDAGGVLQTTELAGPNVTRLLPEVRLKVINTTDFRKGVIYAANHTYKKVISTVDGAIIRGNETLLGRKHNETAWRFMGGFTEVTSESDEEDLSREAMEEMHLKIRPDDWYYLGRVRVLDWRYHNSGDVIRTGFYVTFEFEGTPEAGDDLADVRWVSLDATPDEIPLVPEHRHLWDRLQAARNMVYEQYTTAKRAAEARRKLASVVTAIPDEDVPF
jgi:bifunctional NMN adenylyltransferase/nudix hydrolase